MLQSKWNVSVSLVSIFPCSVADTRRHFVCINLIVARLPVLCLRCGSSTGLPRPSCVSVPLFAAIDASPEGILSQIVPLNRWRRLAPLPLFLNNVLAGPDWFTDLVPIIIQRCVFGWPCWPFRWLLLGVPLVYQGNILVNHVVLQISGPVVVGLSQLGGRTAAGPLVLSLWASWTQLAHQLPEGLPYFVLRVSWALNHHHRVSPLSLVTYHLTYRFSEQCISLSFIGDSPNYGQVVLHYIRIQ